MLRGSRAREEDAVTFKKRFNIVSAILRIESSHGACAFLYVHPAVSDNLLSIFGFAVFLFFESTVDNFRYLVLEGTFMQLNTNLGFSSYVDGTTINLAQTEMRKNKIRKLRKRAAACGWPI